MPPTIYRAADWHDAARIKGRYINANSLAATLAQELFYFNGKGVTMEGLSPMGKDFVDHLLAGTGWQADDFTDAKYGITIKVSGTRTSADGLVSSEDPTPNRDAVVTMAALMGMQYGLGDAAATMRMFKYGGHAVSLGKPLFGFVFGAAGAILTNEQGFWGMLAGAAIGDGLGVFGAESYRRHVHIKNFGRLFDTLMEVRSPIAQQPIVENWIAAATETGARVNIIEDTFFRQRRLAANLADDGHMRTFYETRSRLNVARHTPAMLGAEIAERLTGAPLSWKNAPQRPFLKEQTGFILEARIDKGPFRHSRARIVIDRLGKFSLSDPSM